jgi:hypothetical protein
MTAEPVGGVVWSPDPWGQKAAPSTVEDVLAVPGGRDTTP